MRRAFPSDRNSHPRLFINVRPWSEATASSEHLSRASTRAVSRIPPRRAREGFRKRCSSETFRRNEPSPFAVTKLNHEDSAVFSFHQNECKKLEPHSFESKPRRLGAAKTYPLQRRIESVNAMTDCQNTTGRGRFYPACFWMCCDKAHEARPACPNLLSFEAGYLHSLLAFQRQMMRLHTIIRTSRRNPQKIFSLWTLFTGRHPSLR